MTHGIAENKQGNANEQAIGFINYNLDIKIDKTDIDRSHRIGHYDKAKKKAWNTIVKFPRYNLRGRIFHEKWKLKGTGKSITERLTTKMIGPLNDARGKYGFNNVWSYESKILYEVNNEIKSYYGKQLMAADVYGEILLWLNFSFSG